MEPVPELVVDFGTLERPGVHVLTETLRGGSRRRAITVAPVAAEGDLEPLSEVERERIFGDATVIPFRDASEGIAGAVAVTIGSEYKTHLLVFLLVVLLLEPLVANRSALRRSGKPSVERAGDRSDARGGEGRSP
jgi:hypothetical protein